MANIGSQMKLLHGSGGVTQIKSSSGVSSIDMNKRYVLVVEDSKMIIEVLVETLKSMDRVAVVAENGRIALEKFTSFMREG